MRRFIASLPGKVLSHVVITALMVPYFALGLAAKGGAQLGPNGKEAWAVVNFTTRKGGTTYGADAAASLYKSFEKLNTQKYQRISGKYEMQTPETVARIVETLGLVQPLSGKQNILAVGAELGVDTIASGEVVDYRVDKTAAGKQARASMRVLAYDQRSGEVVNGAAVAAFSTVRSSDTADDVLVKEALDQAAREAVSRMDQQSLPKGYVLNTFGTRAILNQGTRTGFKDGTQVLIFRGKEQVAAASVYDVSADQSFLNVTRSFKGIQPGDQVRAIFDVPTITPNWNADGTPSVKVERKNKANSSLVTTLLVVGLVALLAFGSSGRNNSATDTITSEAYDDPTNGPSVRVSWQPNGWFAGNGERVLWQVFRNDRTDRIPVRTQINGAFEALDNTTPVATITYSNLPTNNNFSICNASFNSTSATGIVTGVTPGRPYLYSVNLVFVKDRGDLPGGASAGGATAGGQTAGGATAGGATAGGATAGGVTAGGATAGGATAGGATAGGTTATTAGGTTAVNNGCFFLSELTQARGYATPLARPTLVSPPSGQVLQNPQTFSFNAVRNAAFPINVEYVIQISSTVTFTQGTYIERLAKFTSSGDTSAILATSPIDLNDGSLPATLLGATTIFWRIGAKNPEDNPGPVPDRQTQKRYIFSAVNTVTRPSAPPPPPTL